MSKSTLLESWPDEYVIKMVDELIEETQVKKTETDCPWTLAELDILEEVLVDWKKIKVTNQLANEEKNLFSYHYSAMYAVPNGVAYHDGIMTTDKKIKTNEQYEELKKEISPDNAHKMSITSLSFLGLEKEE